MYCRCYMHRVQKTRCPLVQEKLFCLWDKWVPVYSSKRQANILDTIPLHISGQAINHACSFSSFQLAQRTTIVNSGTRETEDSLKPTGQVHLNLFSWPNAKFLSAWKIGNPLFSWSESGLYPGCMYVYHHFAIKHCIPFLKTLLCAWLSVSNSAALIHNRTDWGNCLTACAVTALAVSSGCNKIDTKNDMKPSKKLSVRIILLQRRGELNMVACTTVLALIKSDSTKSFYSRVKCIV